MCGIAGILDSTGRGLDEAVRRMTLSLTHRGPDDEGFYLGRGIALGHRRLSIIDIDGGTQPLYNEDRSMCIVYNGEVYNHGELKAELTGLGHTFRTKTDTEAILHAYEQWGSQCVKRFNGMFAFAIWDERKKTLFMARDRLGIKPLFYCSYGGKFVFASEIKAILTDAAFKRAINKEALASYFSFSYILPPLTIFENIKKLEPGHTMTHREGRARIEKYWDLDFTTDYKKSEDDFIHESMELLEDAVKMRLMSDVPLGAFLSGGIDSSAIVALMEAGKGGTNTFTIGFGGETGAFDDERKYARLVAARYNTRHRELEVRPELEEILDSVITAFDEPFADDATIPSYHVSRMAARDVKVILSGLGGDEDYCGYERYLGFQISKLYRKVPGILRDKFIKKIIERLPEASGGGNRITHMKRFVRAASVEAPERYLGFVNRLGGRGADGFFNSGGSTYADAVEAARERFLTSFNAPDIEDPLNRVFYCDMKNYLPEDILACTDRISMSHSLEVRVPFLDHRLVEYAAAIPPELKLKGFKKKYLLKKAVAGLIPQEVITHKKQGFVGPMSKWLQNDLKEYVLKKLSPESLASHGLLNPVAVKTILDEHFAARENNDTLIWSMLVFQRWFELYMDGAGARVPLTI